MEKFIRFRPLFSIFIIVSLMSLNSCVLKKLPGADAQEFPPEPEKRVQKNMEEGRGFRIMDSVSGGKASGEFDFASSNELWRASLDTIDFMPLALANYSGGIIVTDWYSDKSSSDESIKISIRFLTNEIRSDALNIKIFYKKCSMENNCQIIEKSGDLSMELSKKILTKAAIYAKQNKDKNKKPYINEALKKK